MYRTIDLKTLYQLYDFKFIVQFESWYLRNIILIVLVKFNLVYLNIHTSYDFKTSYNFQLIDIIFDKRLNGWCWFTEFVMWDGEMDGLLINLFIISSNYNEKFRWNNLTWTKKNGYQKMWPRWKCFSETASNKTCNE